MPERVWNGTCHESVVEPEDWKPTMHTLLLHLRLAAQGELTNTEITSLSVLNSENKVKNIQLQDQKEDK